MEPRWRPLLNVSDVAWGNGVYVAVGLAGNGLSDFDKPALYTSADGFAWTLVTSVQLPVLADVEFGNGTFVALSGAEGALNAYTSTDGVNWTSVSTGLDRQLGRGGLAFGAGVFVGAHGDTVLRSADGRTWAVTEHPGGGAPGDPLVYGAGKFVWGRGSELWSSADGTQWSHAPLGGSRPYWVSDLFATQDGVAGVAAYNCCFGETGGPWYATFRSEDGASWNLDESSGMIRVIDVDGLCLTFWGSRRDILAGASCDVIAHVPEERGFSASSFHVTGPAYLIYGYAGILASRDGITYSPALIETMAFW